MGYMSQNSMKDLVKYYFPEEKNIDLPFVQGLTPAKMENICLNCENLSEICDSLRGLQRQIP